MYKGKIRSLLILALLMASGLTFRLFDIAVFHHKEYVAEADQLQNVEKDILPKRGTIWLQDAAAGKPSIAAESIESYAVSAVPVNVTKKAEYAHILASFTGTSEQNILASLNTNKEYMPPIKHGLTKEEVQTLANQLNAQEKKDDPTHQDVSITFDASQGVTIYFMGGVIFQREYERVYPEGGLLGQTLGFVNDDGKGQYGFEGQYDGELKGFAGKVVLEQDSTGTLLSQTQTVAGHDGTSYELTIDRNVQFVAERELAQSLKDDGAESGSVIIMDPKTGEIIAMANEPSYDPNNVRDLTQDQVGLLDNPAISKEWEPGSIFKPLVMAGAMDMGAVTPDTTSDFPESVTVDGHVINTALRTAYGVENMSQVLANSDNVAMVWVANKMGNQKMFDYLKAFGFGQYTGVDLENETAGELMPVTQWQDINRATISFGQGIAVTPLQIATAYAAIANDGKMVKPHIVKTIIDEDGTRHDVQPAFGAQVIKPEVAKELRDMMVYTVESAHNKAGTPGYKIGGKTGTAQIPDPVNGGYIDDAYNHSFVGIGPSDDPKYVMLVKIDHPDIKKVGLYAESTAVPLFGRISSFLLNYYQIPPTNAP